MKKKIFLTININELELLDNFPEFEMINIEADLLSGGVLPDFQEIGMTSMFINKKIYVTLKLKPETYVLTEEDKPKIAHILEIIKLLKVEGIKWSSLNSQGEIDTEFLEWIIQNKGSLKLIYGRAVDSARDYQEAVLTLKNYVDDIEYITTSGGAESAIDGMYNIKFASMKLPGKIIAGSRITSSNIEMFMNLNIEGIHMYRGIHDMINGKLELSKEKVK